MIEALEVVVDQMRLGFRLEDFVEVVPRVRIEQVPELNPPTLGLMRYRGQVIAVIGLRERLSCPQRRPLLSDHFVILRTPRRILAVVADRAMSVRAVDPSRMTSPPEPHTRIDGVALLDDGLLLVVDVDALLSPQEEQQIDQALQGGPPLP